MKADDTLKPAQTLSQARESNRDDLCASCRFGCRVAFANALKREWVCQKGLFTLTEKRFSGRILACELHEPAESAQH